LAKTVTDYRPIDCAAYSELELAILRRRRLRLVWQEGNVYFDREVTPLDLQTRAHEEFLVCRGQDGETFRVRLDCIRRADAAALAGSSRSG
jgi:Rho-binding antiterminator